MWSFAAYFVSGVAYRWIPRSIIFPYSRIGQALYSFFLVVANGTFCFFLKLRRIFSFSSNFALILVDLPRPTENTSGKLHFSSIINFSASAVMHSTFLQNLLIGRSHRLNFWNTQTNFLCSSVQRLNFLFILFSDTGIIISSSNSLLSPVTVRTVLLVIFIIGLFDFLQVCKIIIDKSEPESNWNLTDLFSTLTVMHLRMILSDSSSLFCMSDSVYNYFSISTL